MRIPKAAAMGLGIMLLSATLGSGPAQAQSWFDNFDEYAVGSFPSPEWQPSGNTQTEVVNSTYVDPDQSVQMYGVVGGCWGAVIHRELQVTPPYTIQLWAMNGDESLSGCHPIRATVALQTGPSWTYPDRLLSTFAANGDFLTDYPSVTTGPEYPLLSWINIRITYELPNAKHVRIGYYLNGKLYKSVTTTQESYESQLAWLTLASNEGTSWFDDVSVVAGVPLATTTTLTSSPNPSTYGEPVTLGAAVTSASGTPPDGEAVAFVNKKEVIGTGVLSGGTATLTTSTLSKGTHSISAVYGGDANFGGSGSNVVKQVVRKAEN